MPLLVQADRRRRDPQGRQRTGHGAGARDGRRRRVQRRPHRPRRLAVLAHRRGADLRPAHPGLRARPAPVARVLHPHPDRRARVATQQRRHRRPAGVHQHAVEHGGQLHRGGGRRHHDAGAELAGHAAVPGALPDPLPGVALRGRQARRAHPPADGRQRRPRQPDDRAVQRRRRDAAQALRPSIRGGRPVRREGGRGARPRHPDLADHPHLLRRHADGPGPGHGPRLRRRRLVRHRRDPHRRHPAGPRDPAAAPARPVAGPLQRPGGRHDGTGQLRAGLRGARPAVADQGEAPPRVALPRSASRLEFDHVSFTYPGADDISLASLEVVARAESRAHDRGAARHLVPGRQRPDGGTGRPLRRRQDHDHAPGRPAVRRRRPARCAWAATTSGT